MELSFPHPDVWVGERGLLRNVKIYAIKIKYFKKAISIFPQPRRLGTGKIIIKKKMKLK
jgi:hypothetical protein